MKDDYLACYHALDVQPGCSWTQLRTAYRNLVRQWHPDRFHQEPQKKDLAEEKIKAINQAFERLSSYRQAYGHLPVPAKEPRRPVNSSAVPSDTSDKIRQPAASPAAAEFFADTASQHPTLKSEKSFRILRLVMIGFVIWLAYALWSFHQSSQDSSSDDAKRAIATFTPGAGGGEAALSQPEEPPRQHYFTVGSTPNEVQAAQGIPSKIEDGVWYYGKSRVYFAAGVVSRWVTDPSDPLKVDEGSPPRVPATPTFTIGSTKAEVKSIQGLPLLETDSEWDYGVSKVYFKRNRVVGWYSSPLSPLKTAK